MAEQSSTSPKKSGKKSRSAKQRQAREKRERTPSPVNPYNVEETKEKLALGDYSGPDDNDAINYLQAKEEELALIEARNEMMYGLPFLYAWKWYPWAREFYESRNKQNFLCAANQISKSSTQIRKAIHWATEDQLWPGLWSRPPSQFWYLYPSQDVVNIEFELKWEREFLPRGKMKDDPKYGWKALKDRGDIKGIKFNSGVYLFFKTYSQDVQHLQTGTCDAIFCDEELPEEIYPELIMRLNATDGYFHMVFTATLGQDLWRRTMEHDENEEEAFPAARKWTISLYESMEYEDGSPSIWSKERIEAVIAKCGTQLEVLKRVYGRFIILAGRKFPSFDITKHLVDPHPIPLSWTWHGGVDIGAGGEGAHPAAIAYTAVSPDRREGIIVFGWRGDKVETTNDDIILKCRELRAENRVEAALKYYDHARKDFEITARRMQETYLKAEKGVEIGEGLINTLFKNNMLKIFRGPETPKLAREISTLRHGQSKKHAKDDFVDAARYSISNVIWDLTGITGLPSDYQEEPPKKKMTVNEELNEARTAGFSKFRKEEKETFPSVEDEIEEWNEAYG